MNMKLTNYKVFQLDHNAVEFIKDRLHILLQTPLSEFINSKLDLSKGHVFTLFPDYVRGEKYKLENFNEGGILHLDNSKIVSSKDLLAIEVPNTIDVLVEYTFRYLQKNLYNTVVIENILAKPEDEIVKNSNFSIKLIDESVYFILNNKDDRGTILDVIKECSSIPEAIGIFTLIEKEENLSNEVFLREAVNNITGLYVEAYDHEGFLIWEKGNTK